MNLATSQLYNILFACDSEYEKKTIEPSLATIIVQQTNGFASNPNEVALIMVQLIPESGGFQHRKEIGGGVGQAYGTRYYGRGFIQLTWEDNYRKASQAIHGDGRLVNNPDLVSEDPAESMRVSLWYWQWAVRPADGPQQNKFGMTTKAINPIEKGPWNETAKRRYGFYRKAASVLGVTNLASNAWE